MSEIDTYFHNVIVQDFIKLIYESYRPLFRGRSTDNSFIRTAEKLAILIGHFPEKFSFNRPTGLVEWDFLIDLVNTIKHQNRSGGRREIDILGSHQLEMKGNLLRFKKHRLNLVNRQSEADWIDFFKCCEGVMKYYIQNNSNITGRDFSFDIKLSDFKEEVNLKQSEEELITSGVDISFITTNDQGLIVNQKPQNGFHVSFYKDSINDRKLIFNLKLRSSEEAERYAHNSS